MAVVSFVYEGFKIRGFSAKEEAEGLAGRLAGTEPVERWQPEFFPVAQAWAVRDRCSGELYDAAGGLGLVPATQHEVGDDHTPSIA